MRPRAALALLLLCLAACAEPAAAQRRGTVPPVAREFRAAWVATVDNIDWPSRPGLPTALCRAELDAIVARAAALGLNALVFQVRPAADALYRSALEPWSEWLTGAQGKAPDEDWDPLQHVIERCHAEGLQLHAWFNPYRAAHPAGKSPPVQLHVRRREPGLCVDYGQYVWMDPGEPRAADWSMAVILDVVRRYDVDGVHIDDYFYPYPERDRQFPDDASYARYQKRGGKLGRDDWRRQNIDDFIARMYRDVHAAKPWVQVGISPFGIARPGVPSGIQAGVDQFAALYADVQRWMREGWYDYMAPQLYWPIDQKPQSFATLLPWWLQQYKHRRHVWPGLFTGRALSRAKNWRPDELAEQITRIRSASDEPGHIHFSFKTLRGDEAHVAGVLRNSLYREPAAAPAAPWLGTATPPALRARREQDSGEEVVSWELTTKAQFVVVQLRDAQGWRTARIVGAGRGRYALPAGVLEVAVSALGRTGVQGPVTRL